MPSLLHWPRQVLIAALSIKHIIYNVLFITLFSAGVNKRLQQIWEYSVEQHVSSLEESQRLRWLSQELQQIRPWCRGEKASGVGYLLFTDAIIHITKLQGDRQPFTFTEVRGGVSSSAEKFWKPQLNSEHGQQSTSAKGPGATLQMPEMVPSSPPSLAQRKRAGWSGRCYFLQLVPQCHHPVLQPSGIWWAKEISSGWNKSHRLVRVKLHIQHGTAGNGGRVGLKSEYIWLHKGANLELTLLL